MTHPFIPFENVAKLEMVFLQFSQYVENVHHFHNTAGSFGATEMDLLAAFMKGWWNTNVKPNVPNTLQLVKIRVRDLTTETSPAIEYTTGLPLTGGQAVNGAPSNVTLAIKWTTGFTGRSYRGRTYFVGLQNTQISSDQVENSMITTLQTWYGILINAMLADWELVVASGYNHNAWRTSGVATKVTGLSIDPYVDSQRRRLVGRGR